MSTRHETRLVLGALVALTGACGHERTEGLPPDVLASLPRDEPIESTGADTRLDLIRRDDPSAFDCLVELGRRGGEFYDKVTETLEFPPDTLAALVPKPRVNLTRFHGVFAPNSRYRAFMPSGCA